MRVTKWLRSYSFIILIISLAYLLTRQIFLFGRRAAGNYLIQKSLKRKSALLAEIRSQEGRETTETRSSPRSDDGDWEKVESGSEPTGRDGKKARSDWDGIIGFLHPFWYVVLRASRSSRFAVLLCHAVLRTEKQRRGRRRTSSLGSYSRYAEAVAQSNVRGLHWRRGCF